MQDIAMFDIVIILITLFLGLKGLFKGFIKEVFGLLGIVGAIFIASRISLEVGNVVASVLNIENESTIKLLGFIISVIAIWFVIYSLGIIVSKIFSASGLGIFDRVLGFVFGAAKVFLIFSIIAYAINSIDSFKKSIDENFSNSIVMPHLISVGSYIMKLDTNSIKEQLNEGTKEIQEDISTVIEGAKDEAVQMEQQASDFIKEKAAQEFEKELNRQKQQFEDELKSQKDRFDSVNNQNKED
ncbi:CvpA family protein [Aliarcobacter skirrowii]|jgi:membrane protein required for colicin V production|uniref:CvpA family protein n=1 Tax=Aliarcobacter skirrowii TaxID=28200 RepID=UPI000823FD74|nr:CvpA family protein [Aliarcobacter skirrowii]MCT7447090.1 CvpA family protein [Aliarcobacter skirrowii]MDX4039861.1 CvpA family protein [Aliarcobacter skirrowii]MDX4049072.1 CvpA family protein [Aliarcobacter skirrowii]MDX4051012.1 CvpA family protein [Aliarcobacter skirrowii]MDX4060491.1 CvpA family protein [Aliarcobacter skirrowii]